MVIISVIQFITHSHEDQISQPGQGDHFQMLVLKVLFLLLVSLVFVDSTREDSTENDDGIAASDNARADNTLMTTQILIQNSLAPPSTSALLIIGIIFCFSSYLFLAFVVSHAMASFGM